MTGWAQAAALARQIEWSALRLARGSCPLCEGRLFVRFSTDLLGTRCLACRASAISLAIGSLLRRELLDLADRRALELSSRGPLYGFLSRAVAGGAGTLVGCEYFDDVAPGSFRDDVLCQDVQQLTFPADAFDLCTHTEVFEHVPDDRAGFREIFRVLAPGGVLVFTVPLSDSETTVERACFEAGKLRHLLEPVYHDDLIRGAGRVLVYRDYGRDVIVRLEDAGFTNVRIETEDDPAGFGCRAQVVIGEKPGRSPLA